MYSEHIHESNDSDTTIEAADCSSRSLTMGEKANGSNAIVKPISFMKLLERHPEIQYHSTTERCIEDYINLEPIDDIPGFQSKISDLRNEAIDDIRVHLPCEKQTTPITNDISMHQGGVWTATHNGNNVTLIEIPLSLNIAQNNHVESNLWTTLDEELNIQVQTIKCIIIVLSVSHKFYDKFIFENYY